MGLKIILDSYDIMEYPMKGAPEELRYARVWDSEMNNLFIFHAIKVDDGIYAVESERFEMSLSHFLSRTGLNREEFIDLVGKEFSAQGYVLEMRD